MPRPFSPCFLAVNLQAHLRSESPCVAVMRGGRGGTRALDSALGSQPGRLPPPLGAGRTLPSSPSPSASLPHCGWPGGPSRQALTGIRPQEGRGLLAEVPPNPPSRVEARGGDTLPPEGAFALELLAWSVSDIGLRNK